MTMIDIREGPSPFPETGANQNKAEITEFVKTNTPKLAEAFWGIHTILGLPLSEEGQQHIAEPVIPVTRFTFTSIDGKRQFEAVEGPLIDKLIKNDEELGNILTGTDKQIKRKKKDYRKFRERILANSAPFWDIEGRQDDEYIAGRIEYELPAAVQAIRMDRDVKIPEGMSVEDFARDGLRRFLSKRRELIVPVANVLQDVQPETPEVISSQPQDVVEVKPEPMRDGSSTEGSSMLRRRKVLAGTLAAGVPLALLGANEITKSVPSVSIQRMWSDHFSGKNKLTDKLGVELKLGPDGSPALAVVTPPDQGSNQNEAGIQVKTPEPGKETKVKDGEESIASAPFLIDTVKNKKEVIVAKARKYGVPERFMGLFVQLRSAGNSKAGDRSDSDAKGLLLITDTLAQDEVKNIKGMSKYDLLKDDDNLEIGASRLANLIKKYGGLDTNEQIAGIAQEFIGVKTDVPAFLSAIWLQQKDGDYTAFNMWVNMNIVAINNARISQGLKPQ